MISALSKEDMSRPPGSGTGIRFLRYASLIAGAGWALVYACKYFGLGLDNFDAGIYNNLAYNLAHGRGFHSSVLAKNHLGEHFSPVMLVFAPLYRVMPGVHWLLMAQLASWLAVPWALRRVMLLTLGQGGQGWIVWISLAWMLYQPVTAAMNFPFHPSTLAMPFIIWAFHDLIRGHWVRMSLFLLLLLAFKENLFLVWIGFGLFLITFRRNHAGGLLLVLAGAVSGWLILEVIMPQFRDGGWQHWTRFGPASDWPRKVRYLFFLLAPLGFLPAVYWRAGILVLPALLPNLGSHMAHMYSRRHHYDDLTGPLLFCAMAVILPVIRTRLDGMASPRRKAAVVILGFLAILSFTDVTPLRSAWLHRPTRRSIELIQAMRDFDRARPDEFLYVPDPVGVYFQRTAQARLTRGISRGRERGVPGSLLILPDAGRGDGRRTLSALAADVGRTSGLFERLGGAAPFPVYRVLAP